MLSSIPSTRFGSFLSNQTIVAENDNSLSFWNANTGLPQDKFFRIQGYSISYQVHPQADNLLTLSDGIARLWSLTPQEPKGKWIRVEDGVTEQGLSVDGSRIITLSETELKSYDLQNDQTAASPASGAVLSDDKSYSLTLTKSELNNVHIRETATNREIARFIYQSIFGVDSFDVSPDRQFLYVRFRTVAGSFFLVLKINQDQSCTLISSTVPSAYAATMVFSPDSKHLAAIIQYKKSQALTVWELPSMHKISLTEGFLSSELRPHLRFSNAGNLIAELVDNRAVIWELPGGNPLRPGAAPFTYSSRITASRFSPDDKYLLLGYEDGTVAVWDLAQGARTSEVNHRNMIWQIEFSPSGDRVFAATGLWVHVFSWKNHKLQPGPSRMHETNWIPPFRFLAGAGDARLRFLSSQSWRLKVQDLDFDHPEGEEPIKGEPDELLRTWSLKLKRKSLLSSFGGDY